MEIYEKIRALREETTDLTQTQLGQILNMSQRKISRLETGNAEPTPQDLKQICIFYNVSADYILGLPDLPYPKR